jgi:hypothetical protein
MLAATVGAAALLAGCNNDAGTAPAATDAATDTAPAATDAAATPPAGWDRAALGLREAQLLDADLLGIDGVELGEVQSLLTGPDGRVDRLLVEVADSDPDRYVEVPVAGLTVLTRGSDIDVVSTMTVAQLAALPDASPPAATPPAN